MSIFELVSGDGITANDPGFPEHPSTAPDEFDQTTGATRFTIWIPTESVTVNMGNPVRTASTTATGPTESDSGEVQVDGGFVAQTDHHVHFHTFGAHEGLLAWLPGIPSPTPARTVVRLGTPVKVVQAGGLYGSVNTNDHATGKTLPFLKGSKSLESTDIGSTYPPPYNQWEGYAMVTEGGAYQESWGNHLIVSGNADVRIAGQRSVVIGSPSDVHIMANGLAKNLAAVVGNSSNDADIQGSGNWVDEQQALKILDAVMGGLSLVVTVATTIESFYHMQYSRPSEVGKSGWKGYLKGTTFEKFNDLAGTLGSLIAPGVAIQAAATAIVAGAKSGTAPTTGDGASSSITLYASKSINAVAAFSSSFHSEFSVSVTSGLFASISSNVATSLSSLISTTVSGAAVSIGGLLSVGMSSQFGTATVTGRSSAQLSSWGKVFVSGNDDTQVNSMEGNVFVHGNKGFYIACGAGASSPVTTPIFGQTGVQYADGPGYGIVGLPGSIVIGQMQKANNFTTPTPDATHQITIDNLNLKLQHNNANITMANDQVTVNGKRLCFC